MAAIEGQTVLPKPEIGRSPTCDARVVSLEDIIAIEAGDQVILAEVLNPFGLALSEGINLNEELRRDPSARALEHYTETVKRNIAAARGGVFYVLVGASPDHSTPMQYGGHFLELDREILAIADLPFRVVYIAGGEGTFLDFVSDLPAEVFAWDSEATGVTAKEMRAMRSGALASRDAEADVILSVAVPELAARKERAVV